MRRVEAFVAAAALCLGAALPAGAGSVEPQRLTLKNEADRAVECAVIVDGKKRTFLKIRPGKLWAGDYDPRRKVQLVCERGKEGVYDVKAGATYAFSYEANRVQLAEAAAE
jgi:hypothetical protein